MGVKSRKPLLSPLDLFEEVSFSHHVLEHKGFPSLSHSFPEAWELQSASLEAPRPC